jgi:hypothetical protein
VTIPSTHSVGDNGHTTDHNSIVAVLNSFGGSLTTLQAAVAAVMEDTDNNISITDQVSYVLKMTVPSGSRGSAPPLIGAFVGSQLVAGMNAYGELFAGPNTAARVGFTVQGVASQSGNLQNWLNSSGAVLAFVSAAGALTVPALTSTTGNIASGQAITAAGSITAGTFLKAATYLELTESSQPATPTSAVRLWADAGGGLNYVGVDGNSYDTGRLTVFNGSPFTMSGAPSAVPGMSVPVIAATYRFLVVVNFASVGTSGQAEFSCTAPAVTAGDVSFICFSSVPPPSTPPIFGGVSFNSNQATGISITGAGQKFQVRYEGIAEFSGAGNLGLSAGMVSTGSCSIAALGGYIDLMPVTI